MKVDKTELLARMSIDPWFSSVDERERREMLANSQTIRLGAGEYAFRQGDAPDGFFGLAQGFLKVSTLRSDGREGILAVLETGNWFGELSVLDGKGRTHDVAAVGPAELLFIGQSSFDDLMQRSAFSRAIALLQARHTRVIFAMLEDATLYSTRARIARRLQRLARGDITMSDSDRGEIKLSQDWLAMMLGVTRQTLAIELKAMVASGAISLGYGKITIESMTQLKAMEADEKQDSPRVSGYP